MEIDIILVPQGQEHSAVCRGLSKTTCKPILVFPIPIGNKPLIACLQKWQQTKKIPDRQLNILVMGLCGSLSPQHNLADIVVYKECLYLSERSEKLLKHCDSQLTNSVKKKLKEKASLVRSLTSDRVICSAEEKRHLGETCQAEVVDMEGFAILEACQKTEIRVTMVRVISDDCNRDLPDMEGAINSQGNIEALPTAIAMLKKPIAAVRLIRGSLKALQILEQVTKKLFSP
ncbi:MAG: hypothetical protein QNJ54_25895 [Prochloraceae cyanobacterium]|nr:hypothetical protein [Prochloraceae cyanobacterium]